MRAVHRQDCVAAEKIMYNHLMEQLSILLANGAKDAAAKTDHNNSSQLRKGGKCRKKERHRKKESVV